MSRKYLGRPPIKTRATCCLALATLAYLDPSSETSAWALLLKMTNYCRFPCTDQAPVMAQTGGSYLLARFDGSKGHARGLGTARLGYRALAYPLVDLKCTSHPLNSFVSGTPNRYVRESACSELSADRKSVV